MTPAPTLWPEHDARTARALGVAALSRRWAVATPAGAWPRRIALAEAALARRFGCAHAVTVANGSAALVIAMQALEIGPGDRVLLPAFTWVGCITSVLRLGAVPVLCDASPDRLTAAMTGPVREAIDAIIAIPLYAQTVDMAALRAAYPAAKIICDLSHLSCSPALGAPLDHADALVSSLQASKALTCGEGGFVGTNDAVLARRLEALRTDGRIVEAGELRPLGAVHGANYALSEISAGLLLDQIARLDDQSARRAEGGLFLLDRLDALGVRYYADRHVVAGGLHYGIAVEAGGGVPTQAMADVLARTGLRLGRCYPALLDGPLCDPAREARYRGIAIPAVATPNARHWHESLVQIPQEVFLAGRADLERLACCLAGRPFAMAARADAVWPDVTVVVVTDGRRPTLARALASVAAQTFGGNIRLLIVLDRCERAAIDLPVLAIPIDGLRIDLDCGTVVERVARLRDMALRLCESDLVCFLDDDNCWAPEHLDSLFAAMRRDDVPAAHSWRRLRCADGTAWDGTAFPWLDHGSARERALFEACRASGIIEPGSDIVRDTASAGDFPDAAMIDLGAWLFRTDLLRLHGLSAFRDGAATVEEGIGEDDVLLASLKASFVPIACTGEPTLEYWLGGFSNAAAVRDDAWREAL